MAFADGASPPPPWVVLDATPASGRGADDAQPQQQARHERSQPPLPEGDAEPDPHDVARQIVLRQLTMAPRSRHQLEQALAKRGCDPDVASAVLDRMAEVGLVDDAAYAGMLVRSQQAGRGLARRALAVELRRKGIDDELAREALDEVDPRAEEEQARVLVAKRMRTLHGQPAQVQVRRLAGLLARKGYGTEVALRVVREAVREADEHLRD